MYDSLYINSYRNGTSFSINRGCPRGVMIKATYCGIVGSSYSSRAITFTSEQIPLGKVGTPLSSQLWMK